MKPPENVLDLIGSTPMLKLTKFDTGLCELYVKLENQNPGGSIKDRTGRAMIEAAERAGRIKPGDTLIEATTGNTGIGLATVAAYKGYRLILIVPERVSRDKILHLKALGADVRLARSDVDNHHPEHYKNIARRLEKELPRGFYVNQSANPANPLTHEQITAPEMWRQMEQRMDALVSGVGSGGTLTGCARFLKSVNPDIEIVLADPEGSTISAVVDKEERAFNTHATLVEDMGGHAAPENFVPALVDHVCVVSDEEAFSAIRRLLRLEGILGGVSTGLQLAAALQYCQRQPRAKRVVTLVCDTGHKYLSTAYDQHWLLDHGLVPRRQYGDLRDLISHRADEGEVVSVTPDDVLINAYTRMRMFDVSQLPVLEGGRIVGMIDESDLLMAVFENRSYFDYPVRDFMISRLETVQPSASVASLLPVFRGDHVAIIADGDTFYGLITQVDLINNLRNSMSNNSG